MNRRPTRPTLLAVMLAASVAVAACGGGGDAEAPVTPLTVPTDTSPPRPAPEGGETSTTAPAGVEPGATIASLEDAYAAVVRIEAEGTFVHPVGFDLPVDEPVAGYGSGFSIGDNVVVTVAQTVVGASNVTVHVPGEDQPRTGTVRSVDECGGIALVDVDGAPLPMLQWYDQDRVREGLAVFSAGYPTIDSEYGDAGDYLQAGGYVDTEASSAATSWADPGLLVTHGAPAYAGMHGGPLLDETGRVVAVVGARDRGMFRTMNNGLFAGFVVPMVQRLLAGDPAAGGAGINLQAIETDTGLAAIWVAGVHPDSPAARSGIAAGDLLTQFGDNGSFYAGSVDVSEYCRTLRTDGADGTAVEVARYGTGDRFTGRLGSELRLVAPGRGAPGAPYAWIGSDEFASLPSDEFGHINLDLPVAWVQRRTAPVAIDQASASFFLATTDVGEFEAGLRGVSGVRVRSSSAYRQADYSLDGLLERVVRESGAGQDCTGPVAVDLTDIDFASPVQRVVEYHDCGDRDTVYTIAVGQTTQGGFTIEVQTVHDAMHPLGFELIRRAAITGQP